MSHIRGFTGKALPGADGPVGDVAMDVVGPPDDEVVPVTGVCVALPASSFAMTVASVSALRVAVASATANMVIGIADGTYALSAGGLTILSPGVTLRSSSGDAAKSC